MIDFTKYAEAFGARGSAITSTDGVSAALKTAMDVQRPVAVLAVSFKYSQNYPLIQPLAQLAEMSVTG